MESSVRMIILLGLGWLSMVCAQFFPFNDISHPLVVRTAQEEAQLPPHLLNPHYMNPRLREALARSSWFGPGENRVVHREADRIPRAEIHAVLKHAGLLPEQQRQQQSQRIRFF